MASILRAYVKRSGISFQRWSQQQCRMEGNMPIVPNKYIEEWNARRENLENEFRFTPKNVLILAITCVAVPIALFKLTIYQLDCADAAYGRERRRFWPRDKARDD